MTWRLVLIIVAAASLLAAGWVLADLLQAPSPGRVEPIVVEAPAGAGDRRTGGARPNAPEGGGQGDAGGAAPAPPPPVAPAGSGSGPRNDDGDDDAEDGSVSQGAES